VFHVERSGVAKLLVRPMESVPSGTYGGTLEVFHVEHSWQGAGGWVSTFCHQQRSRPEND
jgi:hypothetical protein